ncbi:MAG: amino acid ABC transporter substrate-binding protein [Burkholderiales bacterium]
MSRLQRAMVLAIFGLMAMGGAIAQGGAPIRIGINVSMTGPLADAIKPTMWADEVWEKQINARGGLLGRKVELTFLDNKSNADAAVAIYDRFIQGKYDFIFEDSGSIVVQRESTLAEQHKKLFLVPNGFARSLYERGYKYIFYTGAALSEDVNLGVFKMLETLPEAQRPKSIAYVTVENIAFTAMTKGLQEMLKPLKLATALDITYPTNLNDATPLVSNLKQKGADVVFQTGLVNDTTLFARAVAQQDLKYKMLAIGLTAGAQPNFLPSVGAATLEGMVYAAGWVPSLKTHQNAEFVKAYTEAKGFEPTYNAAQGYARWQIFEQAVNATKSIDNDVLRDYIAANTFQTVQGPIKYNSKGYVTPTDTVVTQFQGGKRVIVWPKEEATGKLIYPKP